MDNWEELKKKGMTRVKGSREEVGDVAEKLISGSDFAKKIAAKRAALKALKGAGKAGLKSIPLIGGVASALSSGDASAAVPVLGDVESLGPEKGSPESIIEDPSASDEERRWAIEQLRNKMERR